MPYIKSSRLILNIILVCLTSLIFSTQVFAGSTQVSATVSNNSVVIGNIINLTITVTDGGSDDYRFDSSSLRNDFNVSSPSQSQEREYINGVYSQQIKWIVSIQPKKLGKLKIPAFKIGSLYTRPIIINVTKASQTVTKNKNASIFITNTVNKKYLYLGQPLILTTVVYLDAPANSLDLNSPVLDNADIEILGKDVTGKTIRNGIQYETITRKYQIHTKKTGNILINSPLLTGSITKIINTNGWRRRGGSQPINVRGDALNVMIKVLPKAAKGAALVSDNVQLFDDSDFAKKPIYAGDPITRNVTLRVASITKESLPTINFNYPKTLRFYPDKDKIKKINENGTTYTEREMQHAIIADKAGKYILPEIKLAWWDSKTDKLALATIPARTLTVLPAKNTAGATNNSAAQNINNSKTTVGPKQTILVNNKSLIYWQIITFILLILLLSLMAYHIYYRKNLQQQQPHKKPKDSPSNALLEVKSALQTNNPSTAYLALLRYSQLTYPSAKNLSQISGLTDLSTEDKASLAKEITKLSLAYTSQSTQWESRALLALLTSASNKENSNENDNIMNLN